MKRTLTVLLMVFLCVSLVIAVDATKEDKTLCSKGCVTAKVDAYKSCENDYRNSSKNCINIHKQCMINAKNLTLKNESYVLKKECIQEYTNCRKIAINLKKDCKTQTMDTFRLCRNDCTKLGNCKQVCDNETGTCLDIYCKDDSKKIKTLCNRDGDCKCGVDKESGECFYGNKKYVNEETQCPDFCSGISGNLEIRCINKLCTQVEKSA